MDNEFKDESNFIGVCAEGYRGNLCVDCDEGWAHLGQFSCVSCSNDPVYYIRAIVIIILAIYNGVSVIQTTIENNT